MTHGSRWLPRLMVSVLAGCLLLAPACVRLSRQRVSASIDAASDTLRVLIFYDGVHDSGDQTPGAQQLPEFAANGDIMLGDWPLHFQMSRLKAWGIDESIPDSSRQLALAVVKNYQSRPAGHYTDAAGRIGAAQVITLSEFTKIVSMANDAINDGLLKDGMGTPASNFRRTTRLWLDAAQKRHRWLRINGQSLEIAVPVSKPEWTALRTQALTQIMQNLKSKSGDEQRHIAQFLAAAPLSVMQSGGMVTLRLGDPEGPSTFRGAVRPEAPQNLVEAVKAVAPADLDAALAGKLVDPAATRGADAALAWVLDWGPPEQAATALIHAAKGTDPVRAGKAVARLAQWARDWNENVGTPEMPKPPEPGAGAQEMEAFIQGCAAWAVKMAEYPLPESPSEPPQAVEPAAEEAAPPPDVRVDEGDKNEQSSR